MCLIDLQQGAGARDSRSVQTPAVGERSPRLYNVHHMYEYHLDLTVLTRRRYQRYGCVTTSRSAFINLNKSCQSSNVQRCRDSRNKAFYLVALHEPRYGYLVGIFYYYSFCTKKSKVSARHRPLTAHQPLTQAGLGSPPCPICTYKAKPVVRAIQGLALDWLSTECIALPAQKVGT